MNRRIRKAHRAILGSFRTGIFAALALTLQAVPLQLDAQKACPAKVEDFAGEKPIVMLPNRYRDGIIGAVLPDLRAQAIASGYDQHDLQPARLSHSLYYWPVPVISRAEHLWVVRFNIAQACDRHDGCATYIRAMAPYVKGSNFLVYEALGFTFQFDDASTLKAIDSKVYLTGP